MNELLPIYIGNILYLDPSGEITFSIAFDKWLFDYLHMDMEHNIIDIK